MKRLVAVALVALTAGLLPSASTTAAPGEVPPTGRLAVPNLRVTTEASGLSNPWDAQPLGGGAFLVTERDSARLLRVEDGRVRRIGFPASTVWRSGETGLMSLEIDPKFRENRRFYTCQGGFKAGGGRDVRVVAWRMNRDQTRARKIETLLAGIQATTGRHGGCRLLITPNGALLVGTGDAAVGTNPRNLRSLNGKVLRMNRFTGRPWPTNPWPGAAYRAKRFVLTYGHRNVQGLALRPGGQIFSVEHGSYRDDEVNRVRVGGDYGWHPVPGYNESVPMTDQGLPGTQQEAVWSSGDPTIATSGAAWVHGPGWGDLDGTLAVAALKGQRVVFMKLDRAGNLVRTTTPAELRNHGRLRSVSRAPNGDLILTTANGSGDAVLRVHPRG